MSILNTLTPIQHKIIAEISRIFDEFGAKSDLQCILGSWGDTLPEDEILEMFKGFRVCSDPQAIVNPSPKSIALSNLTDDIVKDAYDNMQG